jgi:hypothetical protein
VWGRVRGGGGDGGGEGEGKVQEEFSAHLLLRERLVRTQ